VPWQARRCWIARCRAAIRDDLGVRANPGVLKKALVLGVERLRAYIDRRGGDLQRDRRLGAAGHGRCGDGSDAEQSGRKKGASNEMHVRMIRSRSLGTQED
jgi:hypothetical protein